MSHVAHKSLAHTSCVLWRFLRLLKDQVLRAVLVPHSGSGVFIHLEANPYLELVTLKYPRADHHKDV